MRNRQHYILAVALVIAVGAIALGLSRRLGQARKPAVETGETGEAGVQRVTAFAPQAAKPDMVCQTLPEGQVGKETSYTPVEPPRGRLDGFHEWDAGKKEKVATELMKDRALTKEELEFIKAEVFNKKLDELTRNNLSNAMVWQDKKDPPLHKVFLPMIDDPNESAVWRDYALQFLSSTLPYTREPDVVINKLKEVALHGRGEIQGTAAVHLALHEADGRVKLEPEFSKLTAAAVDSEKVDLGTRSSLLAVMGERKDLGNLEQVRKYAKQDEVASLKRTAIAALGSMGDATDLPVIEAACKHKNRAVQMAAKAALERLKQKTAPESKSGPPSNGQVATQAGK